MIISAEGGINEANEPCLERPSIVVPVTEVPTDADGEKINGEFQVDTKSGGEGKNIFILEAGKLCERVQATSCGDDDN